MAYSQSLTPLRLKDPTPYLETDPLIIQHNLRLLARRPELIALYPDDLREVFALSAILQLNDLSLLLDSSPDEPVNQRLLSAKQVCCVANLNSVHVQFELGPLEPALFEGRSVFVCKSPLQILRLQRRDYYRLSIPISTPLYCQIPLNNGEQAEISISDISLGGIGLLGYLPELPLKVGSRLANCRIELPQVGLIVADLEICTSAEQTLKNGIKTLRTGCRFMHLPGIAQTLIQRYINQIDRKRIALE